MENTASLLLEDGTLYRGRAVGKKGTTTGEICFNTGMTGYQEIFTDPSYYGQLLVATNAHIGNYGTKDADQESNGIKIAGLICKNFTVPYSRQQADQSIEEYFQQESLVGIADVDTRAIVKHIRHRGAMNAIISSEHHEVEKLQALLDQVPSMKGLELASKVSTASPYDYGEGTDRKVAVFDFGVKRNILDCMAKRGCQLRVFPAQTSYEEVMAWKPDGLFFSNGPGDPAPMTYAVEAAQKALSDNVPLFGICLGHQILALAVGIDTFKMHNGHRGINHPVKNIVSGRCEITSQNHGFGVLPESVEANRDVVEITHINLNDESVEGIKVKGKPAFSVQYHPESSPGPHDSRYLFDDFIQLIDQNK
ncbi:MAG: glutamine-hydrolyzing carbamoyl-phosphate synthase small subunit [Saprospiraceae bacterium]|nr:glutamine-hydrolyzing carbamoyl-phosphate synthase small subunit [Saprospiraceae bacterium]